MIEISVPEQGVEPIEGQENVEAFFRRELDFYTRHSQLLQSSLQFGNSGLNASTTITRKATDLLSTLARAAQNNNFDEVSEYIEECESLNIVVGAGTIGQKIDQLVTQGQKDAAHWLFRIYSSHFIQDDSWTAPFRAIALGQPANAALSDINNAKLIQQKSFEAFEASERSEKRLSAFIEEKTDLITTLEELYRKKLPVEAPAITWQTIANEKKNIWRIWLALFCALVMGPIILIGFNWNAFFDVISHVSAGTNGGFSITGLAAISAPALFYAWLLKNISRIFIQNLMLADDAAHRKALAITYLGLAENEKIQILEAERAIILNALFRPIPPNSADEGPPVGLLELLKK